MKTFIEFTNSRCSELKFIASKAWSILLPSCNSCASKLRWDKSKIAAISLFRRWRIACSAWFSWGVKSYSDNLILSLISPELPKKWFAQAKGTSQEKKVIAKISF